jgi:murein DD-endopeptidase MepM/ murein hydrolase activator NlpD
MRSLAAGLLAIVLLGSISGSGPGSIPSPSRGHSSLAGPGAGSASLVAATPRARDAPGSYRPPVAGPLRVLRGFTPPADRYQAGHLGIDLADPGGLVLAAGTGTVRFAGPVAGRGVVVVSHPDGISTEYEPVAPSVRAGQQVRLGQPIGRLTGRHPGCPVAGCLHWGAHYRSAYLDPLSLLRPLGPVRLLPWDYRPVRRADVPG